MEQVLIAAHLLIVVAMIAVILLQRSEGGALGIGGGTGGMMSVRGSANLLTRTTIVLAGLFFVTSVALTILSQVDPGTATIVEQAAEQLPDDFSVLDALNQLQGEEAAPVETAPAPVVEPPAEAPADGGAPAAPVSQ